MSTSAKIQSLSQLRAALDALNSFELPDRYRVSPSSSSTAAAADGCVADVQPLLSPDVVTQYTSARNAYLKSRVEQLFLEYLPTYDAESGTFAHPPVPSTEEEEALKLREENVKRELIRTAEGVEARFRNARSKYDALAERRDELNRMVSELEKSEAKKASMGLLSTLTPPEEFDSDMSDDGSVSSVGSRGSVDEADMVAQEQRLEGLIHRRNELKARLRVLRGESALKEKRIEEAERMLEESKRRASGGPDDVTGRAVSPDAFVDFNVPSDEDDVEEMQNRAAEIRAEADKYRDMAESYDSMREIVEQLGGVRILGVEEVSAKAKSESSLEGSEDFMDLDADNTAASITEMVQRSKRESGDGEELCVKIELLGRHVLRIGLGPDLLPISSVGSSRLNEAAGGGGTLSLRAVTACFLTDTVVTDATIRDPMDSESDDEDEKMSPGNTEEKRPPREAKVSLPIPSPSDLLRLSRTMPPDESVRFLVRECGARIRATEARASILAKLKVTCMTTVYPQAAGAEEGGGLEQQVVCSLGQDVGVTASLKLSADCPLLPASVRIDQLVGVGGWDEETLENIRERVNELRLSCPLEAVETLGREVGRTLAKRKDEGGNVVRLPVTPKLPKRQRGDG